MRNILILAIILLCSVTTFSQEYVDPEYNKVLDTSRYVITYEAIMTQDSLNPDEKEYDRIILEIGNNLSRSYSYRLFQYDSLCKTYFDKGRNEYPSPRLLILPVDVYKYFFENKMVVLHRTPLIGPIIQYSEEKNLFKWEMTDEKKDIIGFVCTKATCEFRGRNWTVWFTTELPVSDGPWKFNGLPGLILKAEDDKGHYSFVCIGINNTKSPIVIMDKYTYEKESRKTVMEFEQLYYEAQYDYFRKINPGYPLMRKNPKTKSFEEVVDSEKGPSSPYNPIELE